MVGLDLQTAACSHVSSPKSSKRNRYLLHYQEIEQDLWQIETHPGTPGWITFTQLRE